MAELGYLSLLLALAVSIYSLVASIIGIRSGRRELGISGQNGAVAVMALITLASAALIYSFVTRDFSVRYVAENSSLGLPIFYTVAAFWGGQAGSLLLWMWLLSVFSASAIMVGRRRHPELMPYATTIFMALSAAFLTILVALSNPFELMEPPPDGRGLNPLLQNPGMTFHPPALYLGYVGFSVPFAFAVASLLAARLGEDWIVSTRRWAIFSWLSLTMGVIFGGWWAYVTLGWGGIWAWDPVENASIMPWFAGTAYLHSVMVQERRRMLKVWNLTLIIITFSLALFGTFLTRSGVLSSVHSFAQSPWLGSYFLLFIGAVLIFSLGLVVYRGEKLKGENELDSLLSRESSFLGNNLLLLAICFSVFLGTIYPLVAEAIRGVKVSVGAPFFNRVTVPLALLLLLLMGVGPLIPWRKASLDSLRRNFMYPLAAGIVGVATLYAVGIKEGYPLAAYGLALFVAGTIFLEFFRGTMARRKLTGVSTASALHALVARNKRRYGGLIVHLGIVIIVVGVTGSFAFQTEYEGLLKQGESLKVKEYSLRFDSLSMKPGRDRMAVAANFTLFNQGHMVGTLAPEKRFYRNQTDPVGKVAIRSTLAEDFYLILGNYDRDQNSVTVKAVINPLVAWVWLGGGVLALGTVVALMADKRKEKGDKKLPGPE